MPRFRYAVPALAVAAALATPGHAQQPPEPTLEQAAAADAAVTNSSLDAPLFYQLLIGELELRQGEAGTAYQVLLDAARKVRDERLYKRATDIALEARAGDQALTSARAWRAAFPQSLEAARYEVQILVALNRVADTVPALKSILMLVPASERAGVITSLPRFFTRNTDGKAVVAAIEQALMPYAQERVPGESPASAPAAWVAIGRTQAAADDPAQALLAVQRAQMLMPNHEGAALLAIELLPTQPDAQVLVQRFLDAQPPAPPAPLNAVRLLYARALATQQRYAQALPLLDQVTRETPQIVEAWITLGAIHLEQRQPQAAEAALTGYLEQLDRADQPGDEDRDALLQRRTQAYLMLSQAAEQRKDYAAAESWLAKVDSRSALQVQTRRASLLAQQGRLDEARQLIRQLPETSPEEGRAKLLTEVQLLRDQKAWKEAHEVLVQANQRFPDDIDLLYEQAMLDERLDRLSEMESLLRRVIALKPDHHHAYNALGYSLADRNLRLDEAKQLIERALALAPGDPFLLDSLGWVEYRRGDREAALRWLRQAYEARPNTEIAAHLGEVLWVSGDRDGARQVWSEGKARDGANDVLKETLARLKVGL